ncbi:hypothetical protein C1H46_040064 [Malus baccata]|uniref:Uncharacterized protein n=1 Tax=Malus baccata TaxID=106549 RepID=A0A540KJM0_MALBA|nr:hypothetical protein C1H46_040064 [Malus baccata]
MCSTMTRLVRWRVKDWASCFLACRFLLDDEPADRCCPATPQLPIRNMAFDTLGESRSNETGKKMSRHENCDRERRLRHSPKQAKDTSCRPRFSDEEYIVFCFKEDGAFEVVKNGRVEASNTIDCASRNSPRPANRKDEEEEENYSGPEQPPSSNVEGRPTGSVESSDSNQSDGSTDSFAFPVYVTKIMTAGWAGNGPAVLCKCRNQKLWTCEGTRLACIGFQFQFCRF